MIKNSTWKKIIETESHYGSLISAYEETKITYSTYYRWRNIILDNPVEYNENIKKYRR